MGKKNSNKNKKRFFKKKWFIYFVLLCLLLLVVAYFAFEILTAPYRERAETYDLSKIDDVEVKSLILDRKGREIGRIFVENRDKISIDKVPEMMINALVAGEDQRFFTHDGVDRQGVLRAVYLNAKAGKQTQGASTITQQLARNAFHLKEEADKKGEGGLQRKAVEAYLAMRIEKEYSKREILEFYLNRIPFGSGYYGIRSASLGYFGKEPINLTISECASLVGCIKNPTRISPLNSLEENKKARNQVLKRMIAEEMITELVGKPLMDEVVVVNPKPIRRGTSHLYERVASAVRKHLGEDALTEGGYKIHTTIDLDVQNAMEKSLQKQLAIVETREGYQHPLYESYRRSDGAPKYLQGVGMMVDNDDGSIIAYVGGRDFTHSQYDFVNSGRKPLGTAFLPFVYATAIEKGNSAVTPLEDRPMDNRSVMIDGREGVLGEWGMETLTPSYEGEVTLRRAFESSKIAASVRLGNDMGLGEVQSTAQRLGMNMKDVKLLPRLLVGTSIASLPDLVKSFTTFPNEGYMVKSPHFIDRIIDSKGKSRYRSNNPEPTKRVMAKENAYIMHSLLKGSLINGAGLDAEAQASLGDTIAGKSGTTYDFSNNWFVGYNGTVTCGMWMGFLDGSRAPIYSGAFSRETVMPSWVDVMKVASDVIPPEKIAVPERVVTIEVCKDSGMKETGYCKQYNRDAVTGAESYISTTYREIFIKGREPKRYCDFHGASDTLVTDDYQFGSQSQQLAKSYSIPIQPKEPVLLGQDPYGAEQPDFAPRDTQARKPRDMMTFDALDDEDSDAAITLDLPDRIIIYED